MTQTSFDLQLFDYQLQFVVAKTLKKQKHDSKSPTNTSNDKSSTADSKNDPQTVIEKIVNNNPKIIPPTITTTDLLELVPEIHKRKTKTVINEFCEHPKKLAPFLSELRRITNRRSLKNRLNRILHNLSS